MKKWIRNMSMLFLVMIAVACGNDEIDGKGPDTIPIEWANAHVQKDQSTMVKLLDKENDILDADDGPDNDETIQNYKLTKWKVDDNQYFYEITYEYPSKKNKLKTDKMEVIQTDSGWKRAKYGDIRNFDKLVEDLEPDVIRELHDE